MKSDDDVIRGRIVKRLKKEEKQSEKIKLKTDGENSSHEKTPKKK